MIGELNHRVKNLLGVMAGIAHQTARSSETVGGFIEAFGGRPSSLGDWASWLAGAPSLAEASWAARGLALLKVTLAESFDALGQGRCTRLQRCEQRHRC